MHTREKKRTQFFVLHQTNPPFTLRTGREQSLGWTGGCQSPIRRPVPQGLCQAPVPALQRGELDGVPKPSQATFFSSPGSLGSRHPRLRCARHPRPSPRWAGDTQAAAWRNTSYFRHCVLTGYSTTKLYPILLYIIVGI